jgi:hypothetical protein
LRRKVASSEEQVEKAVAESGLADLSGNRARAISLAAARYGNVAPNQRSSVLQHFGQDLSQMAKRRNQPKSWGILVTAMDDAIAVIRTKPPRAAATDSQKAEPPEPTVAEQIRTLEELIAMSPKHPQSAEFRAKIENLKRKPAESEGKAKAQRVGQR